LGTMALKKDSPSIKGAGTEQTEIYFEVVNKFVETGCICDQRKGHTCRPSVCDGVVERVKEAGPKRL
ncbi:hypothetical protein AVEN_212965-1, partial [Araneus ventricosus]